MNDSENRRHQTFTRVQGFGIAHTSDFAPNSLAAQTLAALDTVIIELDGHAAAEASSRGVAREGTTTRGQAREELRADLVAINRTARAMAADVPGIADKFRLPPAENDQLLLNAARAAALDAAPISAQFIAYEMPADFLADLNDDIARLEATMGTQSSGVGNSVASRVAIETTVDQGVALLRKLDPIMKNKYAGDSATLAEWASASHTERAPRRKKKPPTDSGDGPTEPPTG